MKKLFFIVAAALMPLGHVFSQEADPKVSVKFDARLDGTYNFYTGDRNNGIEEDDFSDEFGFSGRYFKLLVDGNISDRFSYSIRHRMYLDNGSPKDFFGSTDWLYLKYKINDRFFISGGKEVICIGGYEYDAAPIDVYFWSDFWNNVKPFQIGVSAGYVSPDNRHTVKFQVTNSPFSTRSLEGLFAYNAIWYGNFGCFSPIYSVNFMEYERGRFINYIALGNKFTFGKLALELDYMNRASTEQDNFFADFSIISRLAYNIDDRFMVFAKGGYDQNLAQEAGDPVPYDRFVLPGVEYGFYGVGVEYYPIRKLKNLLRLHAFWYSNNNQPVPQSFNIGIRWRMTVFER